jgi:hypothetical protein
MGRPRYICSTCRKDFTRKWNATRHRNQQHQGIAEIIPLGEVLLRKSNRLNFLQGGLNRQNLINDDSEEVLRNDILSKLAPRVEVLERLLSNRCDQRTKMNLEALVITLALCSSEPVKKFDDQLNSIRRGVNCGIVTNKLASCIGVQPIHADAIIRFYCRIRTDRELTRSQKQISFT